jgi:DNA polymerase-3 subunit delta'
VPFDHLLGQQTAVETLTRALRGGHVHHAYRFEGMAGVGKELAAVALAQALLCASEEVLGCGQCDPCRRAASTCAQEPRLPLHPDLVLVERGLYPPETLGRREPESNEISVAQIRRVVLGRLPYPPHEGRARIFLVRRAEELSQSAANALLKALEEPKPRTHFVLLCAQPDRLLPTIRSRSLGVRFGPLPDEVVARILRAHGVPDDHVAAAVALAGGSAEAALEAADPERSAARQGFVDGVLAAVAAPELDVAVQLGEGYPGDRHRLLADLGALGAHYARQARAELARSPARAERTARCHALCGRTMDAVGHNASSQLSLIHLVLGLRGQ